MAPAHLLGVDEDINRRTPNSWQTKLWRAGLGDRFIKSEAGDTIGMLVLWGTLPFEPQLAKARDDHPCDGGTVVLMEKTRAVTGYAAAEILWVSDEWKAAAVDAQLEIDPDGALTLVTSVAAKARSLFERIEKQTAQVTLS